MMLRLLHWQGVAGIAAALALAGLLLLQKGETRHWRKQSGQFEQLYHREQASFAATVADYRAAAERARAADRAAAERVAAEQRNINERTAHDLQVRLADARSRAQRLQHASAAAAHSGGRGAAPVPRLSAAADGTAQGASQDRFPDPDRLTATEQAIQLDELIRWVRRQAAVDPKGRPESP